MSLRREKKAAAAATASARRVLLRPELVGNVSRPRAAVDTGAAFETGPAARPQPPPRIACGRLRGPRTVRRGPRRLRGRLGGGPGAAGATAAASEKARAPALAPLRPPPKGPGAGGRHRGRLRVPDAAAAGGETPLSRRYDFLSVEDIGRATRTTKTFDDAVGCVEWFTPDSAAERIPSHVWYRFKSKRYVNVVTNTIAALSHIVAAAVLVGQEWRRLSVMCIDADDDDDNEDEDEGKGIMLSTVENLRLAVRRGALPNLEGLHLLSASSFDTIPLGTDDRLRRARAALAVALPPFAGVTYAIEEDLEADVIEAILDANPAFDVNYQCAFSNSLLGQITANEYEDDELRRSVFDALIERGADPNRTVRGDSICNKVLEYEVLELLIKAGADLNIGQLKPLVKHSGAGFARKDLVPGFLWFKRIPSPCLNYTPDPHVFELLLANGANPLARHTDGKTCLEILEDRLGDVNHALNDQLSPVRQNRDVVAHHFEKTVADLERMIIAIKKAIDQRC